jgi:hypothetical protein
MDDCIVTLEPSILPGRPESCDAPHLWRSGDFPSRRTALKRMGLALVSLQERHSWPSPVIKHLLPCPILLITRVLPQGPQLLPSAWVSSTAGAQSRFKRSKVRQESFRAGQYKGTEL